MIAAIEEPPTPAYRWATTREAGMFSIKTARGARLTQRGLAEKLRVDPGHLSRIENGERALTPDLALKIARATVPPERVQKAKAALLEAHRELLVKYRLGLAEDAKRTVKAAAKANPTLTPTFGTDERSGSPVTDVSPDSDVRALNRLLDVHGLKVAEDGSGNLAIFSATTGELIGRSFADVVQHMASGHRAHKSDRDLFGRAIARKSAPNRDALGFAMSDEPEIERAPDGRRLGRGPASDPGRSMRAIR
jgi:transcriptional regulator with XRE-family HTH domain